MLRRAAKRKRNADNSASDSNSERVERNVIHTTALADPTVKSSHEKSLEDDVLGGATDLQDNLIKGKGKITTITKRDTSSAPAWEDDDDEKTKGPVKKIQSQPNWAKLKWEKSDESDPDSDTDNDFQGKTGDHLDTRSAVLPKSLIQMKKCTDANKEKPSDKKLKSVEFHPSAQVLLTAGMDQRLSLFQIDGKSNPLIQSVFFDKFPLYSAHFTTDGAQVIMSSRHAGFKYYDMMVGRVVNVPKIKGMEEHNMKRMIVSPDGNYIVFLGEWGRMHFVSARSKEWIDTLQMNGTVESAAFNSDGSKMFSIGDDGEVYVWDVRNRMAVHKFRDMGCVKGTSVAVSKNDRFIATGSDSGYVNVYDDSCFNSANPKPVREVKNLVTDCTSLKFNSTSEVLAMASENSENALKLFHVPSLSVFSNFPDRTESLRIPFSMDFSVNSGYFCVGNHRGQALLYRMKHYGHY